MFPSAREKGQCLRPGISSHSSLDHNLLLGGGGEEGKWKHPELLDPQRPTKKRRQERKPKTSCGLAGGRQPNQRGGAGWQGAVWQRGMKEADEVPAKPPARLSTSGKGWLKCHQRARRGQGESRGQAEGNLTPESLGLLLPNPPSPEAGPLPPAAAQGLRRAGGQLGIRFTEGGTAGAVVSTPEQDMDVYPHFPEREIKALKSSPSSLCWLRGALTGAPHPPWHTTSQKEKPARRGQRPPPWPPAWSSQAVPSPGPAPRPRMKPPHPPDLSSSVPQGNPRPGLRARTRPHSREALIDMSPPLQLKEGGGHDLFALECLALKCSLRTQYTTKWTKHMN